MAVKIGSRWGTYRGLRREMPTPGPAGRRPVAGATTAIWIMSYIGPGSPGSRRVKDYGQGLLE